MKKVLIVEDELVLVFNLRQYLDAMGYTIVDTVADGLTAIDSAREHQPDIILMDIQIRGPLNGVQTVTQIRKFSQAPVIFTADRYDIPQRKYTATVTNACLLYKPFHKQALKGLIDSMLASFSC